MNRQAVIDSVVDGTKARVEMDGMASLKRLFVMLVPYIPMLILVFLMTASLTGLSILIPKVAGDMVDRSLGDIKDGVDLNRVSIYLFGLIAAMTLLRFISGYQLGKLSAKLLRQLRERLFNHIVWLSPRFFETRKTGELNARIMANLEDIEDLLTEYALGGVQTVLQVVGVTAILFYTNYELALIALLVCIPVPISMYLFKDKLEQSQLRENDALASTSANVEEVFRGISTVQAFGNEKKEIRRYSNSMERYYRAQLVVLKRGTAFGALMEFLGYAAVAAVLWVGGLQILAGKLSIGELTASLIYMYMFGIAVRDLGGLFVSFSELTGLSHRVFEILDEEPVPRNAGTLTMDTAAPLRMNFNNVSFSYPADMGNFALNNLSLEIEDGEELAIVGPTGSGKTTILKLLMRFYDPSTGNVTLNDHVLSDYRLEEVRRVFGLVSQDIFLFSGTILENLNYGVQNASLEKVEQAIEAVGATEFIAALDKGLNEKVGVAGSQLSGGQKQLLGIARMYLKNPRVLLLDEATSSLDSESEEKVQQGLRELKKGRTSIVIAHKLATVRSADRILLMNDGQIVSEGNHDNLLKTSETYRQYWTWQSRSRVDSDNKAVT